MQKPDCAWRLADLDAVQSNGIKVMSTFACGGGSSMGYKRAGCEVIAANDIELRESRQWTDEYVDPETGEIYA